ncbi:MAG: TonB-dependent receptor, partial [Bacteroidota bacterium]
MKKNHLLFFLLQLLSFGPQLFAQAAIIKGIVTEKETGTTLPGTTVYIRGTNTGTVTDIDGAYLLNNVPTGTQELVFSFTGFEEISKMLDIIAGQTLEIDESMGTAAIMGETVVVTGQLLGQAKAINRQLNSESIANIVSADKIQELPDVNAAEAISRLPGVAINRSGGEGQKVVIRGMEPKFAAITINGVRLPASSATDRSVDLSIISPEMLDGIEVFKSPLPDMDAEAVAGSVNLSLRRAPRELHLQAKALGGYNELNDDYGDYKFVLQGSKRFFNDKLGVVGQGSIERFNRGGDIISYAWSQGRTDPETGVTEILGRSLSFQDRIEKRRRWNGSLSLDYDLGEGHKLGFFGIYTKTRRDRFQMSNLYIPSEPVISYRGRGIDNDLTLYSGSLSGEHTFGKLFVDWSLSSSQTEGSTPYDFEMIFNDNANPYDVELNTQGPPSTYFEAANPDLTEARLRRNDLRVTNTLEESRTALINLRIPLKFTDKIGGYLKFGGKYFEADRERDRTVRSEGFYYLAGSFTENAAEAFGAPLIRTASNSGLISIQNFLGDADRVAFELEDGTQSDFTATLDPDAIRNWQQIQDPILNNDRSAIVDNYDLTETVTAGYVMMKLNFGPKLSIIPGFRYEYSDNVYNAGYSTINGRYGVNGIFIDTSAVVQYGEFMPHIHLKYKPMEWFDIRASYSNTLARPDYDNIIPSTQINNTSLRIEAGNPNLRHSRSENFDLFLSGYKGRFGLLTIGGFYKNVQDVFIPRRTELANAELAADNGWPDFPGYSLNSFVNLPESQVYGYEVDLQTNLSFLPGFFKGFVFNINYARLYSETKVFFLTSETV